LADVVSGTIIFDTKVPVYWPITIALTLVMFMVVINFIFLSVLSEYLLSEGIDKHTTLIASMIEVGTIPGGIIVWYIVFFNYFSKIGYYTNKRALIIVPSLWIGTLIMVGTNYLKGYSTPPVLLYVLLVFLMGFFIGGVYNNIVGGIAVELGRQFKGCIIFFDY
jgi:OPA family glycerol-3-phosphate transporter-like MFS transporter 3/OPA family glycerol-3-phosphate transporter-like MFS transporter 1/2